MTSGNLRKMIEQDGLAGMTSNPSISKRPSWRAGVQGLSRRAAQGPKLDAKGIYERLAIRDIQDAADTLQSVYDATHGRDGYVSLEVSPYDANNTQASLAEARRLWKTVAAS